MIDDFKPVKRPASSLTPARPRKPEAPPRVAADNFRTPEAVAADQQLEAPVVELPGGASAAAGGPKQPQNWRQKLRQKLKLSWPPGKKEWIVAAVLLLLGGGVTALVIAHQGPPPKSVVKVAKKKVPPKPTTVPSTLSGLPVDPAVNARPVTGVMIENSIDARPQAGLGQASVVFEAIAEGGITRFLALYQDTAPDNIGPVRSARPYYLQWLLGFDAAYAHVGGSPDALAAIKTLGIRDLDQFANAGSYHRITTRAAPHNVYTNTATLNQLETSKGYTSSTFTGFVRKKAAPAKVPTAKSIDVGISGPLYNSHYDYVPAANNYTRSEGGAAHIDANTNTPISPTVVIALVMPYSLSGKYSNYQTTGKGTAYIFQDGTLTIGSWTKTGDKSQFTFADAAGKTLGLNPGPTWLTAVNAAPTSAP